MADKADDANYRKRKAVNQRAYYKRNKALECAKALARKKAQSALASPETAEARKKSHREAQARYRARHALGISVARTIAPDLAEQQKRRHRKAQRRYEEKNGDNIQLMRWVKTAEGSAFRLSMLAPVDDGDC